MSKMIEYLTVVSEIENNEQAEITGDEQEEELKKKQEYHNTFFKLVHIFFETNLFFKISLHYKRNYNV